MRGIGDVKYESRFRTTVTVSPDTDVGRMRLPCKPVCIFGCSVRASHTQSRMRTPRTLSPV
eukprot:6641935-Pyramimonas_sp.AAC.1